MAIDKKRGVDRLMVDLPLVTAATVKRMAEAQKRSVNFILCEILVAAVATSEINAQVEKPQADYGEIKPKQKKPKS